MKARASYNRNIVNTNIHDIFDHNNLYIASANQRSCRAATVAAIVAEIVVC